MYTVKEAGDTYEIYLTPTGKYIGFVRKSDLQDPQVFAKVLYQVLLKTLSVGSSKNKDSSTLGSELFHICTAGIFEK